MNRIIFIALLAASALPQTGSDSSIDTSKAAQSIQLEDIRSKMFFLATDEMGGRLIGTRENRMAANYIASEFMAMGLQPAGDNKSYFQEFDVASAWPDEDKGMVLED